MLTRSFYASKSQKHKKTVKSSLSFLRFLGFVCVKAAHKMLVKLTADICFIADSKSHFMTGGKTAVKSRTGKKELCNFSSFFCSNKK